MKISRGEIGRGVLSYKKAFLSASLQAKEAFTDGTGESLFA